MNEKFYTKKEYAQIAEIFGLGVINNVSFLYKGYGKSIKVCAETDLGKFVISKNILSDKKSISAKSVESLNYEIEFLRTIKGLPVPQYIKSKKGNYLEKFKSSWVTAYKFIPGKAPKTITPKMAYSLGKFLGELHVRGQKFKRILKSRRKFYDLNPRVVKLMEKYAKKQTNPILKSAFNDIKKGVIDNRPPVNLPRGPIHVDIGPNNELFIKEKLSGIIDFGNFYIGELMVDVGKAIMFNCCRSKKLDYKLVKKFLSGYEGRRKLGKKEKEYLKKSILYAIYSHIWVDLYHVPIKYVPESYALYLVKNFLPVAKKLEVFNLI